MKLTSEQEEIVSTSKRKGVKLVKTIAVSGAGKTSTLIAVANAHNPKQKPGKNGLYIAFNKAIAKEAGRKFPSWVDCRTTHSLAYKLVIGSSGAEVDYFTVKCIEEELEFEQKLHIIDAVDEFCSSKEINLNYMYNLLPEKLAPIAISYIEKMAAREIPMTFGFLLKYLHLLLATGGLKLPKYDLLMLDEAGDTTGVTLEIFKLLPAKKKLMVGDPDQNINGFMNTIDGFEMLRDEGVTLPLSQSFRVSVEIAKRVELFCRATINSNMVLKGVEVDDEPPKTMAYISRTNGTLIGRMIDMNEDKIDYSLTRDAEDIFALPLALINLRPDKPVFDKRYRYLKDVLATFTRSATLQRRHKTFRRYLTEEYSADVALVTAIRLLDKYSYSTIYDTYKIAKKLPQRQQAITLTTSHASKGLEWDAVFIEEDTNTTISKIMENGGPVTRDELTECRLAYVACTRAKKVLNNAKFLPTIKENTGD